MKTLIFKTDINCGNCVRAVRGFLDEVAHVVSWEVNTDHPDKVLTVRGEDELTPQAVVEAVEEAGYTCSPIGEENT